MKNHANEKRLTEICESLYEDFFDNVNMTSKDLARQAARQYADYIGFKIVKKCVIIMLVMGIITAVSFFVALRVVFW